MSTEEQKKVATFPNPYNKMYERLVKSPTDVLGMLAYSAYKYDKMEYIKHFKEVYNKPPEDSDIDKFLLNYKSDEKLNELRDKMLENLNQYANDIFEEKVSELNKEYNENVRKLESVARTIDPDPYSWENLGFCLVQNLLGIIATAILFAVIWLSIIGFKAIDVVGAAINLKTEITNLFASESVPAPSNSLKSPAEPDSPNGAKTE